MASIESFLDQSSTSLKICGITQPEQAKQLADMGVDAIGINFWPHSKRYLAPDAARTFLPDLSGRTVRVGVFVNADPALPLQLLEQGAIDLAQFHGDETPEYVQPFLDQGLPFIKAIGVKNAASLDHILAYQSDAVLLDTPAPGVYGGTGEAFDWNHAKSFMLEHPGLPVILAGGITPENASEAVRTLHPAVIDVASGAESAPGIKDLDKVSRLQKALSA
ncbi:phosphoribosylanthranilate isomerase [Verrucomicrobiaceae bacterium N1E253]|uniref:N-(5'-phosphoribosyl)anthranilate isomerase n=1 Tax=Oceaniferula marina TaxID=2748318 RepID=A0A851GI77_9BACT|nr:phosphoribosylanthranilate isomerase [Oceaniferula marina]NWK57056.1 phosphoribosylanthranilate isomerase [Oceaniferula marina]